LSGLTSKGIILAFIVFENKEKAHRGNGVLF
jgi:hypothetical protein